MTGWSTTVLVRSTAGGTAALLVALALGFSTPVAAGELEDRKGALESELAEVQESLEYLDSDITDTVAQLKVYQGRLPAAQEALAAAQGRVESTADEVSVLAARVELAQETLERITGQLAEDKAEMEETREVVGQIAAQAYKNGGVPSNVSLMFGSEGTAGLASAMDMVRSALRSQNAAMDRLSQEDATNAKSRARLVAVEDEIKVLKSRADPALQAEEAARDAADSEKVTVDRLIDDTSALSAKLQEQKPAIEARLASVEEAHRKVNAEIAERQRRLVEEARLAEEARLQAAADARAAAETARLQAEADAAARAENARWEAEAAAARTPVPAPVAPQPVVPVAPVIAAPLPSEPDAFRLRMPVNAPVSSGFGWRLTPLDTIDFAGTGGYDHTGIDFAVACGTPVYAPAAGEVWYADADVLEGAGNRVVLNHGVIGRNALASNFYHLSGFTVSPGQRVSAGQMIGTVGDTGNSKGCHLHFETMLNGNLVDPAPLLYQ
ncbi:M23 family metallopeptidase [Arthrobacter sp. Br18]|uniref:M23 family metallopeptidase n=1 Tax=Arthrobacter sp. Br18 TaxID=1312954 RepID=UPI00047BCBDD|nr:M23 family metallopeptidase [Arthrobacter sp. Br18]